MVTGASTRDIWGSLIKLVLLNMSLHLPSIFCMNYPHLCHDCCCACSKGQRRA